MDKNKITVLIVDDNTLNLKLLHSMLKKNPVVAEVIEAFNGAEAIEKIKLHQEKIDLVLLDIVMPIMGGIEMLKLLRADQNIAQPPVVVLTTDETKKTKALEAGANDFLMKPIRSDALFQKMQTVLI